MISNVKNYSENTGKFQDKKLDEKRDIEKFTERKLHNILVADAYRILSRGKEYCYTYLDYWGNECEALYRSPFQNKAERAEACGTYLLFHVSMRTFKRWLMWANFCKIRLCPMCQWRRSLLVFAQTHAVACELKRRNKNIRFILLTLTIPNVKGNELSNTITKMGLGFNRLIQRKKVDKVLVGWHKSLEVTYNSEKNTYHPHIHVVLAVPNYYFNGQHYIKHASWLQLWRDSYRDQSIKFVNIKSLKPNPNRKGATIEESVAETCKYATKPSDYIGKDGVAVDVFKTLDTSLGGRRLIGYGKEFKKIHAELFPRNPEKATEEELAKAEDELNKSKEDGDILEEIYRWHIGATRYEKEEREIISVL